MESPCQDRLRTVSTCQERPVSHRCRVHTLPHNGAPADPYPRLRLLRADSETRRQTRPQRESQGGGFCRTNGCSRHAGRGYRVRVHDQQCLGHVGPFLGCRSRNVECCGLCGRKLLGVSRNDTQSRTRDFMLGAGPGRNLVVGDGIVEPISPIATRPVRA